MTTEIANERIKRKSKMAVLSGTWPWGLLALAWGTSFCCSCWFSHATANNAIKDKSNSTAVMLLGEGKTALSDYFYEQADTYFHGGWEHQKKEAFHGGLLQKMAADVSPRYHIHLSGHDVKEIMPWLRLATLMNPSDVRKYLDSAFWLAHDAARPDLAEQVLAEAQINNPLNYQIQIERGRVFLMEKKLQEAKNAFAAGLAFWPGKEKTDAFETLDGKARLLLYTALLSEADGNKQDAILFLKEILKIFPERAAIRDRIKDLEDGKEPSLLASRIWTDMIRHDADMKSEGQCKHPGEK
ncbi:MAG: hypothetical protein PHR77_08315 [Kiritimatiellae bacterium]|nr:hypothetical protein [Kiritimatiellia bacterium]